MAGKRNLLQRLKRSREKRRRIANMEPGFQRMTGRHYHSVLTEIEKRTKPDWYLEIGSRTGTSLSHRSCNFIAIDPEFALDGPSLNGSAQMHFMQMTSDAFFASGFLDRHGIRPDFTFVDGMHLFEYALRDFMNAEAAMTQDGIIALHDVCPFSYAMTVRDPELTMDADGLPWTGDVWKVMIILKRFRPDLKLQVLSAAGTGLAVVQGLDPTSTILADSYDAILAEFETLALADFGAQTFFDEIAPVDPDNFLASL